MDFFLIKVCILCFLGALFDALLNFALYNLISLNCLDQAKQTC